MPIKVIQACQQRPLKLITLEQAERYIKEGHFPSGSMKPKIEAAMQLIQRGGKKVVITSLDSIELAVSGESGTEVIQKS